MRLGHTPGMEMKYIQQKTARPCLKSFMKHVKKVGHSCHPFTYVYFTALIIQPEAGSILFINVYT